MNAKCFPRGLITLAIAINCFVWVSPLRAQVPSLGATWMRATNAAPWSGRDNFGAVGFNGQMWVLGGYDGSNWLNEVWSSSDGLNWTEATSAPWEPRVGLRAVVVNEKIWVLGGHNAPGSLNDVWSSSDGMTWTQVTSAAPWSRRFNFGAVTLNGQMWVLGGYDGGLRNDVWSSSDGMTWTQVTNAAPWSRRYHLGAVTLNGKMWVLGGNDGGLRNDVWSSSDGITWAQVTSAAPWSGRWAHRALALNGQMWVLGGELCGSLSSGCFSNDVWSSSDGVNWTLATNAASWSARGQFGAVALNGKMWVLGGYDGGGYSNDVWFSQSTTNFIFAPLQMTSITLSSNNVVLTWTTQGASNVVQVTTNTTGSYNTNNFVSLTNLVITTLATNYVDVGGATNKPARYYRIWGLQ